MKRCGGQSKEIRIGVFCDKGSGPIISYVIRQYIDGMNDF